jgi:hypothetical protein
MRVVFLLILVCTLQNANAQQPYWQQFLKYDIRAELDDKEKAIKGFEKIVYLNNSPSTLDFIWFHLWPNAYKNKNTALFQQLQNDPERSKKLKNTGEGHIENLEFKINDQPAKTEAHPNPAYIDVVKLILNKPLAPGDSITISTPFTVKLPSYFSRSGYSDGEFMACQWYPKPAVFDKDGWHEMPYLDMGEFYSEFANFNVSITLPSEYVVSATGELQTKEELNTYQKIGLSNSRDREGKPEKYKAADKKASKTLSYVAHNVTDFAWFADKDFVIQYDQKKKPSGKTVLIM